MASKKIGIYIDADLLERLNQATVASLQSRSEIVCRALQQFLDEQPPGDADASDRAFRGKVSQLIASGLLQVDDFQQEGPRLKHKPWIN